MSVELHVESVRRGWGETRVLDGIDLEVGAGEIVAILGPSGCGKTTLLRIIAGLDVPDDGTIRLAGRDVADLRPGARDVGMVFQHHALLPHLSVRDNVAFGLRARRRPAGEIAQRVETAAGLSGCADLLERSPEALSGGERQRVALARALARSPSLVLLDEPLSSLDVHDRTRLRTVLASALRASGATALHVTHDQGEAFAIGDRVAVLAEGRIQQIGTADELYDRPATLTVATFVGAPATNVLPVERDLDGAWRMGPFDVTRAADQMEGWSAAVRPSALVVGPADADDATGRTIRTTVDVVEVVDELAVVHLVASEFVLRAVVDRRTRPRVGDVVTVTVPADRVHLFDADGIAVRYPE